MNHNSGSSPKSIAVRLSSKSTDSLLLSTSSQLDFMNSLELTRTKPIKTKDCVIMIRGSKCSICKREFKCITDTQKHMRKKHRYVKRKTDSKLVRVMLKIGKETVCDHQIYRKFLKAPYEESGEAHKSHADCNVRLQTENYKPVEISQVSHPGHNNVKNISKDLIAKGSVPLSFALMDIKSLEASATYKNGRVYKGDPNEYLDSEEKENEPIFENHNIAHRPNTSNISRTSASLSTCVTPPRDLVSPTLSSSDSSTIIVVSDLEMDLSELYEDVKPRISKMEMDDESDDGEIQVIQTYYKNGSKSVPKKNEKTESVRRSDAETMRIDSTEKRKEPTDVVEIEDSDVDDAETVILSEETKTELDTSLADLEEDLEEEGTQEGSNFLRSEDTTTFTVEDELLQGLEEGDQDICIIEEVNQLHKKHQLENYLEEAVLKYVEVCEAASKGVYNNENNNDCYSALENDLQKKQDRLDKVKNSSLYNSHLKFALQQLAIKITPPSLIKMESDFC